MMSTPCHRGIAGEFVVHDTVACGSRTWQDRYCGVEEGIIWLPVLPSEIVRTCTPLPHALFMVPAIPAVAEGE